ncbi:MAG: hypothetical protein EP348_03615 [Alphaproteobacteria bacterium]|nr:MAG: hypothetical protein EP348_03615 [Alphaproteobacteria bacterium]
MMKALAAGLLLALTLTACETRLPPVPEASKPEPVKAEPKTAALQPEEKIPTPPKKEQPVVIPPLKILIGKGKADIRAVFGKPNLLRKEAPAEIWQYLTRNCALHLFFYPSRKAADKGGLKVTHYEVNSRLYPAVKKAEVEKCFGSQLLEIGREKKPATSG